MMQNTEEWKQWRHEGFGASDSNILAELNKGDMTIKKLIQEKIEKKSLSNIPEFIADKGHRVEEYVRAMFEIETGLDWDPKLVEHSDWPFMRASLDGYNEEEDAVLEIKYVGQDDFKKVKLGGVLECYYPQIQKQLFVTGAKYAWLVVATEDKENEGKYKIAKRKTLPNEMFIKEMVKREAKYWKMVQNKELPEDGEKDTYKLSNAEGKLVTKYLKLVKSTEPLKEKLDDVKKEVSKVKEEIFNNVTWKKAEYRGTKLTVFEKVGSISYKDAYTALLQNVENVLPKLPDEAKEMVSNCLIELAKGKSSIQYKITPAGKEDKSAEKVEPENKKVEPDKPEKDKYTESCERLADLVNKVEDKPSDVYLKEALEWKDQQKVDLLTKRYEKVLKKMEALK